MANFEPKIKLEHADSRGEIYSISLPGDKELMLLHSKKGSLRGGHAHDVDETITLLTGTIHYQKRNLDGTEWTETMKEGDAAYVPKGLFHLAEFAEDSWLLEWKLCENKHSWRNINDPEYRAKVVANSAG